MTNVQKLDKKLKELAERGVTGINLTLDPLSNEEDHEVIAADMIKIIDAIDTAKPIEEHSEWRI